MRIYALSDPHLSSSTPGKTMAVFGEQWVDHADKIAAGWQDRVEEGDIVLVAGDISWAMRLPEARSDLLFIAGLPGRKVLIRGNHDYWWSSASKVRGVLPEGMFIIQNDSVRLDGVAFAGSRMWVDHAMASMNLAQRNPAVEDSPAPALASEKAKAATAEEDEKIFRRELNRLEISLDRMDPDASLRIALVHYPPISTDFMETRTSRLLEDHGIRSCVFGHLHDLVPSPGRSLLGSRNGVEYHLTSCDYLAFIPALITEL